jgi:hypothetical protein
MTRHATWQAFWLLLLSGFVAGAVGCSSAKQGGQDAAAFDSALTDDVAVVGTGGDTGTGGAMATGGGAGTGGAVGAGGTVGAGGAMGTGGKTGAGGGTGAGGRTRTGGSLGAGGRAGTGGAIMVGGSPGAGGTTAAGGVSGIDAGPASTCIGAALLSALGKNTVLVGGSMTDATAAKAPFDGRYLYLSAGLFDGAGPCVSCASGCTSGGTSCANTAGCDWWGCWQYDQDPPGQYAVSFVNTNEKASPKQIPMFTYYQVIGASGADDGTAAEVAAINDATMLGRYLADWRFLLQKIGTHMALLHIEPDFWGYVEQQKTDPHKAPAKVTAANPTDCAGYEDSASGLARCMIHMVRLYAPNAKVGLHASAWGTNMDVFGNSNAKLDVVAEAQKMVTFLTELGAKDGDFIVADPSDRDAGFYEKTQSRNTWWDATNATLPNFHQAFAWTKAVTEGLGLPAIYWQIPVGNMSLDDTYLHYKDNRLDYFFVHMDEVAAAHIVGLFFGAGADGPTTPESDGGNFVSKTAAYRSAGGAKVCP